MSNLQTAMNSILKPYPVIVSIIAAIAIWMSIDGCNRQRQGRKDFDALMNLHFRDSSELVTKTNKLGELSVTAKAFQLSQASLDKYVSENAILKNKLTNAYSHINSINTTISSVHIDTIRIPVHDTLPCGDIDKSYPVVDRYYSFDFKFRNRRGMEPEFYFLNISIPDTVTDVIGIRKSGFLNLKRTMVSEQVHTNKYVQVKGVQTIVKSEAKPKTLRKVAIGFGLGVITTFAIQSGVKK